MNKIKELQVSLNDAVREVFDNFRTAGHSIDFTLGKFVNALDMTEEHYADLLDYDKHSSDDVEDVENRIFEGAPYCDSAWIDGFFVDKDNCHCIGIALLDGKASAVIYNANTGDVWEQQVWTINPDIAAMIIDIVEQENKD